MENVTSKKEAKTAKETTTVKTGHEGHSHEGHTHAHTDAHVHSKTAEKTEKTTKGKAAVKKEKVVKVKKFIQYTEKQNPKKSAEARKMMALITENKKWHPVFRGRFGKKYIRRKSKAKWDKWRKPHGIDLDKGLQHGFRPKGGYKNSVAIRGVHPSGYREVLVNNMNDLLKIDSKVQAARIGGVVGKKKRNELVKIAGEKGIWILN
jgi:large subunit ribosomal protein L32e